VLELVDSVLSHVLLDSLLLGISLGHSSRVVGDVGSLKSLLLSDDSETLSEVGSFGGVRLLRGGDIDGGCGGDKGRTERRKGKGRVPVMKVELAFGSELVGVNLFKPFRGRF